MRDLCADELGMVMGGGFWSGLACGLGLVGTFYAVVSPDPFAKIALVTYGGTLVSCVTAFDSPSTEP
jgi:hypothetical protein